MELTKKPIEFYLALILLIYFGLYSVFLYLSDFLPYVIDGNETYSSLVHAYNMYFGDWTKSFWLTDEAFSLDPAAHPFIHTHQGNWPRIYAFLLFAIGARTAESQIILHMLTIGAVSIWLMYRYFTKITNYKFAFITCLIFMTDYLLFAQWHVVTYRVWHCFFVFSSLNCMHEIDSDNNKWKVFTIFNFAALFYWELVFAFYVSFWSGVYYSLICKRNFKKIFRCGLFIASGMLIGLGTLFVQLCLYMGLDNVITDFKITFFARNFAGDEIQTKNFLREFYDNKDIVFFYNIIDGNSYRTIRKFIGGLAQFCFQIHTPALSLLTLIVFVGFAVKSVKNRIIANFSTIGTREIPKIEAYIIPTLLLTIMLGILFYDNSFLGVRPRREFYEAMNGYYLIITPILGVGLSCLIFQIAYPFHKSIALRDLIAACTFIVLCSIMMIFHSKYYEQGYSEIWFNQITRNIPNLSWRLIFIAVITTVLSTIVLNDSDYGVKLKKLKYFIIAAFLSYLMVYILSPGYVYSGYLTRTAPFAVFFVDVIVALFFWFLLEGVSYLIKQSKVFGHLALVYGVKNPMINATRFLQMCLMSIACILIFCLLTYQWLFTQYTYIKYFPANSFSFVKILRDTKFQGKAIISNQYTAPFAYETKQWAYIDSTFADFIHKNNQRLNRYNTNYEYMWYKNKFENSEYQHPDYFVCFSPNSMGLALHKLHNKQPNSAYCSTLIAKHGAETYEVVAQDSTNVGTWSVVKLIWTDKQN